MQAGESKINKISKELKAEIKQKVITALTQRTRIDLDALRKKYDPLIEQVRRERIAYETTQKRLSAAMRKEGVTYYENDDEIEFHEKLDTREVDRLTDQVIVKLQYTIPYPRSTQFLTLLDEMVKTAIPKHKTSTEIILE